MPASHSLCEIGCVIAVLGVLGVLGTVSATLFLERSGPMIVSTQVDWTTHQTTQHNTGVSCSSIETDIMGMEWGHKEGKDDNRYSTLILKMCSAADHTVILTHQSSILGPGAEVQYEDQNQQVTLDSKKMAQDDVCMSEGHLEADPASQVTLIGCQADEDGQVLTIVSDKCQFKSSSYRFSGGHVAMANGLFHDTILHRQNRPNGAGEAGGKARQTSRQEIRGQWDKHSRNNSSKQTLGEQIGPHSPLAGHGRITTGQGPLLDQAHRATVERSYPGNTCVELKDMKLAMFDKLHQRTKAHWAQQHITNRADLDRILQSPQEDILIHEHTVLRLPQGGAERLYLSHTIELCVITDPYLFTRIQTHFKLNTDQAVAEKIYTTVHRTLIEAQTFLRHRSISSHGGFSIKLNGIRVLKDWGSLLKMRKRENLQDVLFDLGDYLQVVNHMWDGHNQSYDLVVLFTGKMGFEDGDGYAYIGGICQRDAPISIKMRFDNDKLNLNMGRLLAHEIGHALGANHDDDLPPCKGKDYLMNSIVSNSMNTWSTCSARAIEKIVTKRTEESACFHI